MTDKGLLVLGRGRERGEDDSYETVHAPSESMQLARHHVNMKKPKHDEA